VVQAALKLVLEPIFEADFSALLVWLPADAGQAVRSCHCGVYGTEGATATAAASGASMCAAQLGLSALGWDVLLRLARASSSFAPSPQ
jgi:hypothetical protein